MFKTYLFVARAAIEQGLRLLAAKYGLAFLGGPFGMIIGFIFSPVLATLLSDGIVNVEFKLLEFRTSQDRKKYEQAIKMGREAKGLTPEQRKQMLKEIIDATKNYISIRKYLK